MNKWNALDWRHQGYYTQVGTYSIVAAGDHDIVTATAFAVTESSLIKVTIDVEWYMQGGANTVQFKVWKAAGKIDEIIDTGINCQYGTNSCNVIIAQSVADGNVTYKVSTNRWIATQIDTMNTSILLDVCKA